MKTKHALIALSVAALITALSIPALAGPGYGPGKAGSAGCCDGPGSGYGIQRLTSELPDEQREQAEAVWQTHREKMDVMRNEFQAKSTELEGVLAAAEPDIARVDALSKEVTELNSKLFSERLNFHRTMKTQFGLDMPRHRFMSDGHGWSRHHKGPESKGRYAGCPAGDCGRGWKNSRAGAYGPGYGRGDCPRAN